MNLALVTVRVTTALLLSFTTAAAGQTSAAAPIDHHNRLLLARAQALGRTDGIVLVLTREGAVPSVVERLGSVGGELQARFDEVGYLRVRLPLARLAALRALPGVLDAQIDAGNLSYGYDQGTDPEAAEGLARFWGRHWPGPESTATQPPAPAAARGRAGEPNPYVPMSDMGITRFAREHPTYDGRGVTIAVLERWVLDLTHPTLQVARTLTGDSVAKIIGIISPASFNRDPPPTGLGALLTADTVPDPSLVRATGPIEVRDSFLASGRWYQAPRPGRYRIGAFAGYPVDAANPYGVIWDAAGSVWVDTDRDRDFRDETPLGDFNRTGSTGFLQADTAGPAARPTSFAVAFDSGGTRLRLYPGIQDHQTMVASVAAGHGILGGPTDASAPGARLVVVDAGATLGDALEGFIRAARDPRIDLITNSQTGERFPSAGGSIVGRVLERVMAHYRKPIFAAANNSGPLLGLPFEPSTAPGVIAVGAYAGRDTYRAHYGWSLEARDWIVAYSARGPARNGGMKPDLLAPALSISASPCANERRDPALLYSLPPCYALGGGTSAAAPHAAGAAAALISAAKQTGVPWDARRIGWALREGARTLAGYGVHEQGAGLLDVRRSWDLLRKRVELPEIEVRAPVRHALARYLDQPGTGPGLFEREGWAAGDSGTRVITLTRTSGRPEPTGYDLRWRGNDGTFSLAAPRVVLPLRQPVEVTVRILPRSAGAHSAALEIVDRPSRVAVHQVLLTVVAAHQLAAADGYTVRVKGGAAWPRAIPFFVNVPAGTAALRVELKVNRGRVALREEDPWTADDLNWSSYFKPYRHPVQALVSVAAGGSAVGIVPSPAAGVWEFSVEPPRLPDDSLQYRVPSDVELSVTALSVDPEPRLTDDSAVVAIGPRNRLGAPARPEVVAELGARRSVVGRPDSAGAVPPYDIDVPPGTTTLRVAVRPEGAVQADLDMYLFDCTTGDCFLWDHATGHAGGGELLVRSPRPGAWKTVIDPVGGPSAPAFRYTDVVTSPRYGAVRSPAPDSVRVVRTGAVPSDREPVLVVDVVDQGLEMEEQAGPLALFAAQPYRPVPLGTAVVPLSSPRRPHP